MSIWKNLALTFAVVAFALGSAQAQTSLAVSEAELSTPSGRAQGQMALVGSQILFVGTENPGSSLAIDRADIASVKRSGDMVTVTTRRSLHDADGERDTFRFRLSQPADLMSWYERPEAAATSPATRGAPAVLASYQAKHDHRIGSCRGTLILTTERVAYESMDEIDDSRQWQLVDIKKVEQNGAYKLKVEPFVGDTFNLELTGKGMDSGEYRRLVDRIARARGSR